MCLKNCLFNVSLMILILLSFGCDSLPSRKPSEEDIKKDLIGQKTSCWNFDSVSEFEDFKFEKTDDKQDLIEFTAIMKMRGITWGRGEVKSLIVYRKQNSEWKLANITIIDCKIDSTSDK